MSDGWFFNGDAGTQVVEDEDGGPIWQTWEEMDTACLYKVLKQLSLRPHEWENHIIQIKEELELRIPAKVEVITSVTVNGKI